MSELDYDIEENITKGVEVLDQPLPANGSRSEEPYNPVQQFLNGVIRELKTNPKLMYSGATLTLSETKICSGNYMTYVYDDLIVHRAIRRKLASSTIWNKVNYILHPEYSAKNARLHYHAIFWDEYQTNVLKCLRWWKRNLGFVKPEIELRHPEKWMAYITKDTAKVGLGRIYNIRSKS